MFILHIYSKYALKSGIMLFPPCLTRNLWFIVLLHVILFLDFSFNLEKAILWTGSELFNTKGWHFGGNLGSQSNILLIRVIAVASFYNKRISRL